MKILAIDTSGTIASVAILEMLENTQYPTLIGEYNINHNKTHSEKLIPMINNLIKNLNIELKDIDCYGIAIGPGSYTGLRIGVSSIKAFAQVYNKPVIGISTLEGLANNIKSINDTYICPILNARNDNVFGGLYLSDNSNYIHNKLPDNHYNINELLKELLKLTPKVLFLGDGIYTYKDIIKNIFKENAIFAPEHLALQKASSIALLTLNKFLNGQTDSYHNLVPNYIRENNYVKI